MVLTDNSKVSFFALRFYIFRTVAFVVELILVVDIEEFCCIFALTACYVVNVLVHIRLKIAVYVIARETDI